MFICHQALKQLALSNSKKMIFNVSDGIRNNIWNNSDLVLVTLQIIGDVQRLKID